MLNRNDPKALRWLLGAQIASFRNEAGLSLARLREITGVTRAKLGTMETGRHAQSADDVGLVLEACGAPSDEIIRLSKMAKRINGRSWWARYADVLPEWFTLYAGLEGMATSLFTLEPWIIPGLLQTEDYARAVTASTTLVRPDHVDRFAQFRTERAARLTDTTDPLRFEAVIAETVLKVRVGDPSLMAEQLDHLIMLAERENIRIQILQPEAGARPVGGGRITVLGFADGFRVAYDELIDGASYVSEPARTRSYHWASRALQGVSLPVEDSLQLMHDMRTKT